MKATCPHCKTVFLITAAQLKVADGEVRCGVCRKVFKVINTEQLKTKLAEAKQPKTASDPQQQDIFNDDEFAEEPRPLIPDNIRHKASTGSNHLRGGIAWGFGILLLSLSMAGQYIWFNRDDLAQHTQLKPWLTQLCVLAKCELANKREPDKIEMLSRNVFTHPNIKNALMISVSMKNNAEHAQSYPDVEIGFSNIRGGTVAARRFTPGEYLNVDNNKLKAMVAGATVNFSLEIQDPGKEAMTYEFSFL